MTDLSATCPYCRHSIAVPTTDATTDTPIHLSAQPTDHEQQIVIAWDGYWVDVWSAASRVSAPGPTVPIR
jgi:hypothetical protein